MPTLRFSVRKNKPQTYILKHAELVTWIRDDEAQDARRTTGRCPTCGRFVSGRHTTH